MMKQRSEPTELEPRYEGAPGKTQLTAIHVTVPEGFVRSVRVYTAVNVTADPELQEAALSGALHRFDGGEELAIPFVYHDPSSRKFALVMPEALRHEELRQRASLLSRLAEDTESPIPPYVRRARVVIGLTELRSYLADDTLTARSLAATQLEEELKIGAEGLREREQRLHGRAETITRKEDEMRAAEGRLEQAQRQLAAREEDLNQREAKSEVTESVDSDVTRIAPMMSEFVSPSDVESINDIVEVSAGDVVELDQPTTPGQEKAQNPLSIAGSVGQGSVISHGMISADTADIDPSDIEEIVDDSEFEEIVDEAELDEMREVSGVSDAPSKSFLEAATTPFTVPSSFLTSDAELAWDLGESLWLFARLEKGESKRLAGSMDLLCQLTSVDDYPIVVLSLVEADVEEAYVRRGALDPQDRGDKAVLEALRADFTGQVAVFDRGGEHLRTESVSAPRRVNMAMVLERAARRAKKAKKMDSAEAKRRALSEPPPLDDSSHPFRSGQDASISSASDALKKVEELEEWTKPEKLDLAILTLSVPRDVVDESQRSLLSQAAKYGIALPPALLSRAVSVGVAPEPGELVNKLLTAFHATAKQSDRGGLSAEQLAGNWRSLLAAAEENSVLLDSDIFDLASSHVQAVDGAPTDAKIDPSELPDLGPPQLVMLLNQPSIRRDAALELCSRKDPEFAETLVAASRRMSRAEVVRVVPRIADLGDEAGDALIDGLNARKTFVRQASALALGHLKLRRAVVPLVHLLQVEESDIWKEVARVLGGFGTGAFRAVSRALKDAKAEKKRLALALAHLANNGCEKQVKELSESDDRSSALVALEGLNLRQAAKDHDAKAKGERPTDPDDKVVVFSRRFKEELEGVAPLADLAD